MNNTTTLGLALTALAALNGAFAGDLTGTVKLQGTPPPEKEIVELKNDVTCGPLHAEMPKTRFYVVGAGGALADVVVSVQGLDGKSTGETAAPLTIEQKGCEYRPYVAACQTKQKVTVKNGDPVMHNVHTTPAASGNKEMNKAQQPSGADLTFSFDAPEEFMRFKCDVHPWMFTYVSVFDHPYFAVTGPDGGYKIANVPPGKYKVIAKHRKGGSVEKEIEVKDGANPLDFVIELKQ